MILHHSISLEALDAIRIDGLTHAMCHVADDWRAGRVVHYRSQSSRACLMDGRLLTEAERRNVERHNVERLTGIPTKRTVRITIKIPTSARRLKYRPSWAK